jgi:hypothetical protein
VSLPFSTEGQPASVDNPEGSGSNLFQDVVMIIDTLLGLDVHRLRNILGVDVENKLIKNVGETFFFIIKKLASGLYYKHITIIIDTASVISK